MIESVRRYARQHWRRFSRGRPGKRFQERYRRRQEQGNGRCGLRPGPGWGTAIIGFVLIAGEFLPAARLLDRAELALRGFFQLVRDIWGHSWVGKVLIITVTVFVVAVLGYTVYAL